MNYPELCAYCRNGWTKEISRMLKKDNGVDILHGDGMLIRIAANHGGAKVLDILIDYYIAHITEELGSDKYLHKMSLLIEILDNARQLLERFCPEVTAIFSKYIPADYEEGSDDEADFVEDSPDLLDDAEYLELGTNARRIIGYSPDPDADA